MKLSIIIPFYNPMPYFSQLLESIDDNICSDREAIEIIFINDGSDDSFSDVLNPFKEKYNNVYVINTENHGVSHAKNLGIDQACGEYVWFVDSDDMLEKTAIQSVLDRIDFYKDKTDIIFGNCTYWDDINNVVTYSNYKYDQFLDDISFVNQTKDILQILFADIKVNLATWYQLFRREFLNSEKIRFDTELTVSEDLDFKFLTLSKAKTIGYLSDHIYRYRIPNSNRNSLSLKPLSPEKYLQIGMLYYKWYTYFKNISTIKNGGVFLSKKFSFFIYSISQQIKKNITDDISDEERFLVKAENIYQDNKDHISAVLSEIKNGNYSLI